MLPMPPGLWDQTITTVANLPADHVAHHRKSSSSYRLFHLGLGEFVFERCEHRRTRKQPDVIGERDISELCRHGVQGASFHRHFATALDAVWSGSKLLILLCGKISEWLS